ncbi:bifunctional DNA primase/polymerase [Microcoleus sp. LAD1_D5]|uniref:bifunctional DNA primase/polymerase n=1 Tax=unclassified Microcoleus TaxID=2642155 RepID=UPI002FD57702
MQTLTASESLITLPANWILEPVCGKRPYRKEWTKTDLDRLSCLAELESGKATGLGLKLGNGLLAIDIDGESATKLLEKLAGENDLSDFAKTTAWTSGRPGRRQCLFLVPESAWERIKYQKILTGVTGDDGKEECLEFRWIGHQSVLPPSLHPGTGKPYLWINDPLQSPPLQAPEWLIKLCENWHSEYAGNDNLDLVRFPARLYAHFGGQMRIWLLARRSDNKGSGVGIFSIELAAHLLNLSKKRVYGLLSEAKKSGLIRERKLKGDKVTVYYTSFEKVVAITGLEKIGPVAAIDIGDLNYLHILATEIEAQHQQKLSLYCKRQEEVEKLKAQGLDPGKIPTRIVQPGILHTCEIPARVLARGSRFDYFESGFEFYGGSQKEIANNRQLSESTISRHLCNSYRMKLTPVHQKRSGVPPLIKKQLLEKLPHLKGMPPDMGAEDGLLFLHKHWWKPHPNIYLLEHRLVSCRRQRSRIAQQNR